MTSQACLGLRLLVSEVGLVWVGGWAPSVEAVGGGIPAAAVRFSGGEFFSLMG